MEPGLMPPTPCSMPIPPDPTSRPTAECLLARIPQLRSFLRRHGFLGIVVDRAVDRVIRAALPYVREGADAKPCTFRNRVSWLFGSALEAARQLTAREPCDFCDPDVLIAVAVDESPSGIAEAVGAAMDRLPPRQREAVELCHLYGLSLAEASEKMGCRRNTILELRRRGERRLRRLLADLSPRPFPGKPT